MLTARGAVLDVLRRQLGAASTSASAFAAAISGHLPLTEALHGVRAVRGAKEVEQARLDDARGAVDTRRLLRSPVELQRSHVRQEAMQPRHQQPRMDGRRVAPRSERRGGGRRNRGGGADAVGGSGACGQRGSGSGTAAAGSGGSDGSGEAAAAVGRLVGDANMFVGLRG